MAENRYTIARHVRMYEAGGHHFLVDPRSGTLINMNETAMRIWKGLEEGLGAEEIAKLLSAEYKVTLEQAIQDTEEFLNRLIEQGLVHVSGTGSPDQDQS